MFCYENNDDGEIKVLHVRTIYVKAQHALYYLSYIEWVYNNKLKQAKVYERIWQLGILEKSIYIGYVPLEFSLWTKCWLAENGKFYLIFFLNEKHFISHLNMHWKSDIHAR